MIQALYLQDTYCFESIAEILHLGKDERGIYLLLSQTIFYPQGGGQPSDQGKISGEEFELEVIQVRQVEGEIRHYLKSESTFALVGKTANLKIDSSRRLLNARYHTAAHLLGNVVESLYPELKAIKGHSFPGEAYVDFEGEAAPEIEKLEAALKAAIQNTLSTRIFETDRATFEEKYYTLPYPTPPHKAFRVMQIGDFLPVPCGGTHLANTQEIGEIRLSKIKSKDRIHHISYEVS